MTACGPTSPKLALQRFARHEIRKHASPLKHFSRPTSSASAVSTHQDPKRSGQFRGPSRQRFIPRRSSGRSQRLYAIRLVIGRHIHLWRDRPDLYCGINAGIDGGIFTGKPWFEILPREHDRHAGVQVSDAVGINPLRLWAKYLAYLPSGEVNLADFSFRAASKLLAG
jgi:hypothetical protein